MGTGREQRLAQVDAELAELGEPTEGTDTLRARVAALSRGDLSELDRELEHMERLTRAAGRRSPGAPPGGERGSEPAPEPPGEPADTGAAGARERAASPSWAQALFDEAESEDPSEEVGDGALESGPEHARASSGSNAGGDPKASDERESSDEDDGGLAALLEGEEEAMPTEPSHDVDTLLSEGEAGFAAESPGTMHEPGPESAPEAYADAETEDEEGYAEIDTGEVEVLVEEDEVMGEEGEPHQVADDGSSRDPSHHASN